MTRYFFIHKFTRSMTPLKKYIWLVDTLMRKGDKGLTLEQIGESWDWDDEMHDSGAFSPRSFHRHRKAVDEIFGINIECFNNGYEYRYRIADSGDNDYFRRWLLDSISLNRIIEASKEVAQYIEVETTHTDSLPLFLHALSDCQMVSFDYTPYWSDHPSHYFNFQPHAVKIFERRWYIIGCYGENYQQRIYALDRMTNVELQDETYQRDAHFSMEEMFDGIYGVIVDVCQIESVWLKVDAYQANYLRSLPLHRSQIELQQNEHFSIFSVRVRPTFDFRQKLLSLGSTIEVLKPATLRKEMKEEAEKMLQKYQEAE